MSKSFLKLLIVVIPIIVIALLFAFLSRQPGVDASIELDPTTKKIKVRLKTKGAPDTDEMKKVLQKVEDVEDKLIGIKATNVPSSELPAQLEVEQVIGTVESGGSAVGIDLSREAIKE